ncbi:DUF4159 domain-containing protein [Microvirga flavescens]|uniref:DUF4159 domain-containing protein n=1 Tax=Microvirga flavescens TaxID=2249811 RepID=UPI000DDB515F|nr:DUF4159 domain-containing protein [Microvirga flavescens]
MFGLPLTFAVPLVLTALIALPAIWLLLRVTPPQPKRIDFPPLKILSDLLPRRETPARTPWWLLLLRLTLAALLIFAAAGPVWNPLPVSEGRGPVLLIVDNGFTAAHDWVERIDLATARIEAAGREGRAVAVASTAARAPNIELADPASALERLRSFKPQPYLADRRNLIEPIRQFLTATPDAEIVWISDGVRGLDAQAFIDDLAPLVTNHLVTVLKADRTPVLALTGVANEADELKVRVIRAEANGRDGGIIRALDQKGLPLADTNFRFASSAVESEASFKVPLEVRNAISRIEILGERSAGAVTLVDESGKRKRVGIVFGGTVDQSQPLLAPTYYISRALSPYAEVREGRGAVAEAVSQLIDEQASVLVLADVGGFDPDTLAKVKDYVERGGLLLRFAGSRLVANSDELVPVRLRRGGRNLGGALSWDTPRTLAPFMRESPFFGLTVPSEIGVRRQILAEPEGDLAAKTWAALEDGTPIVTADRRGNGLIVLFHVTANTNWSNLPLSGLFVDMLRRITALAPTSVELGAEAGKPDKELLAPRVTLDGFGVLMTPPIQARAVPRDYVQRATEEHPAGFYGPADASLAVNALVRNDHLAPLDYGRLNAKVSALVGEKTIDLRPPLLMLALILFLIDTLASLWLGGQLAALPARLRRSGASAALFVAMSLIAFPAHDARAQESLPPIDRNTISPALVTRLAYVITGDAKVDAISQAGLKGLTQVIGLRTSLQPGDPIGVDPARDELAFYPLLYWPIVADRPILSEEAIRKLDAFMKNGGTVIFDTRDAFGLGRSGGSTPEAQSLRRMLATLDIPELEPVPRDHVLTKTFYLLDAFPGRYATGQTWIEALAPPAEGETTGPARSGDGVSPIIITSNDLASAWAVGPRGEALYPVVGGDIRQREMAFRGGINIVMYTLTGNYKADQVHVPDLLQRLGQ